MPGLSRRDNEHHSYGDYLSWPQDARYELIEGRRRLSLVVVAHFTYREQPLRGIGITGFGAS